MKPFKVHYEAKVGKLVFKEEVLIVAATKAEASKRFEKLTEYSTGLKGQQPRGAILYDLSQTEITIKKVTD